MDFAQILTSYGLKLLAKRAYTTSDLSKKIQLYAKRRNIPLAESAPATADVLAKLSAWGYLNDLQFAEQFIRSRLTMKPKSLRAIAYELQRKGISKETTDVALRTADVNDRTSAQKVIDLHQKTLERLPEEKRKMKVYRLLKTRGFSGSIATDIMKAFFN